MKHLVSSLGSVLGATLFVLVSFFLSGCGEEDINQPSPGTSAVAPQDTTAAFSEHPNILAGMMTADQINELGRLEHERQTGASPEGSAEGAAWQLYIPVPFYSQRDGSWASHDLGYGNCNPGDNIGNYGCHLCCIAMLYAKWGYTSLTPPVLNDWSLYGRPHYAFNSGGCGDLIRLPQALQYPAMSRPYRTIEANRVYSELAAGHPVVVRTTVGGSHFMVIFAFDGQRFWVKDPWRDWTQQDQPLYGNAHPDAPFRVYGY
ncbi:MAG: C39 family peptidase [Candidatus Kerfeldbacteria bacterium]|nr:C39 family peptidase [Candidatus Kerfeldbacteria bacterium]